MKKALLLSLSLNLGFIFWACASPVVPHWDGAFWAASSKDQAVILKKQNQPDKKIACNSPDFDNGAWLTYQAIGCLYQQVILNCKEWKTLTPKCDKVDTASVREFMR